MSDRTSQHSNPAADEVAATDSPDGGGMSSGVAGVVREGLGRLRAGRDVGAWLLWKYPACAGPGLAASLVFFVVFSLWFTTGHFWGWLDVGPLTRNSFQGHLLDGWNWQYSGVGTPTYDIGRVVEVAANRVASTVGGGDALAQRLMFASFAAYAAAGGAALARRFSDRIALVVGAGVFAAFNGFMLQRLPNPLPWVAVGAMAFTTAYMFDVARGKASVTKLLVASLPASYLVFNPPLAIVTWGWLAVAAVAAVLCEGDVAERARRMLQALPKVAAGLLACHLWWLLPAAFTLAGASGDGRVGAVTDPAQWKWTHQNNTLANVARLTSSTFWPREKYFPYAPVMESGVTMWLAFLPFLFVVAAAIVARRRWRKLSRSILVFSLVALFMSKGLAEPFSGVNLWLYDNVPGLWLLREPSSKVLPVLIPLWGLSGVLAFDGLLSVDWRARRAPRVKQFVLPRPVWATLRHVAVPAATTVGVLALAWPWPLWTGDVAPVSTVDGATARPEMPDEWYGAAEAVNGDIETRGRALVLPLDDFYQMPTTWGYYGTTYWLKGLFDRPTILAQDTGHYYQDPPLYAETLKRVEGALESGDPTVADALLKSLGVSHVVVRHDIHETSLVRPPDVAASLYVNAGVRAVPGSQQLFDSDIVDVWRVGDRAPLTVWDGTVEVVGGDIQTAVVAAEGAPVSSWEDGGDVPTVGQVSSTPLGGEIVGMAGHVAVGRVEFGPTAYEVAAVAHNDSGTVVTLSEAVSFEVGGARLASREDVVLSAPAGVTVVGVRARGSVVPAVEGHVIDVAGGDRVELLVAGGEDIISGRSGLINCRTDGRTVDEAGISFSSDGPSHVSLTAVANTACVRFDVGARAGELLTFQSRVRTALPEFIPRYCVRVLPAEMCVPTESSVSDFHPDGTRTVIATAYIPEGTVETGIALYSDGLDLGLPLTTVWDDISVHVTDVATTGWVPTVPTAVTANLPARAEVVWDGPSKEVPYGDWSAVGDCANKTGVPLAESGIHSIEHDDGSVTVVAPIHMGCVSVPLGVLDGGELVEVVVGATVEGGSVHGCITSPTLGRCVPAEAVPGDVADEDGTSDGALKFRSTVPEFDVSDGGTSRLYLYVEPGEDGSEGRVRWQRPAVRRTYDVNVFARSGPLPTEGALEMVTDDTVVLQGVVGSSSKSRVLLGRDKVTSGWDTTSNLSGQFDVAGWRTGWVLEADDSPAVVGVRFMLTPWIVTSALLAMCTVGGLLAAAVVRRRLRGRSLFV